MNNIEPSESMVVATTKSFPMRVVLTASTGRLLTKPRDGGNGIEDLYKIAEWMSGEQVWTHQLCLLAEPMQESLLKQFPELVGVNSKLDTLDVVLKSGGSIEHWLHEIQQSCGLSGSYEVARLGADVHGLIGDPVEDLKQLGVDSGKIITVIL